MKAVFLGNHTIGVKTLRSLAEAFGVAGVAAHPPDPEDGVRYQSVFDQARAMGLPVLRARGRDEALARFISDLRPDLIFIADYRYILPRRILDMAPLGAVNLHPSLLPRYRGRAPVNWAILNGETELGLTAHFVDEGMDTGDIIIQERYLLGQDQDVGDAIGILYPLYESITRRLAAMFLEGHIPRRPQNHALATEFPRRTPSDGLVDFSQPARNVLNLVRAVASPYPGAFSHCLGRKVLFWKAAVLDESRAGNPPGTILDLAGGDLSVACGRGILRITRWEGEDGWSPEPGMRFQDGSPS